MKNLADVMFWTIEDAVDGEFSPGTITYGLAEDGVGLAPFHEAEPAVSAEVKARLEMVRLGIIDGWVKLDGTCPTIRTVYLPFTTVTGGQ